MIRQIPTPGHEDRLVRTFSDENFKIRQVETGIVYDIADDVAPCRYTYEETGEVIEEVEEPVEEMTYVEPQIPDRIALKELVEALHDQI